MEMDEGLRLSILMAISFFYGFAMRHCFTMPNKKQPKPIDYDGTNGKGYQPRPTEKPLTNPPRSLRPTPPGAE